MRRALFPLLGLAALILGVVNAAGSSTATQTVTVEVIGNGNIRSTPSGINCGGGKTKCYAAFAVGATITLKTNPGSGWSHGPWADDCSGFGKTRTNCALDMSSGDKTATANFTPDSGATQSTLSITYNAHDTTGDNPAASCTAGPGCPVIDQGNVSAPQTVPGTGAEIDCGSSPAGTDCAWTVLTGSTLTVFQTPEAGALFGGWAGGCSDNASQACTVQLDGNAVVNATWYDPTSSTGTSTLSLSVAGSGKVTGAGVTCAGPGSCTATEPSSSTVTLTAEPNDGYLFTGWSGACSGAGTRCTLSMDQDRAVTATFTQTNTLSVSVVGDGAVTGGSGAINCGNGAYICSANFSLNATVSLVAVAALGSTFTGWTGACGGNATTCTVSMSNSRSVTATFAGGAPTGGFTLTVSVSGSGTVTGTGISCGNGATACTTTDHAANSTVTLTATPTAGGTFVGWSGGTCVGTTTTCAVTFTSSKTVTATFAGGTSTFPLTVSVSGAGRVSGSGISCGNGGTACRANLAGGTTLALTATPAAGATFAGWGGACTGTTTTCTVSMTSAKSVSATFGATAAAGTLTINVSGRGTVSTTAGSCASTGPAKTCVQHFKAGATATLTAKPIAGQSFLGWSGACTGTKPTCTLKLTTAQTTSANFSNTTASKAALTSLGAPIVVTTTGGYNVTLRFRTTTGGVARVRGLRAGRTATAISAKVAAGNVRIGPFPVELAGLYTFEIRLAGGLLKMRACLGSCGRHAPPPAFALTRQAPAVKRAGDVWSVILHAAANQIYDGRVRAYRGKRLLVNQHFLGKAGQVALGPFLLGPGNYTLKLAGVDAYGRARTLTWIVSLA
jgi:Divergent InlB B-repeat domain